MNGGRNGRPRNDSYCSMSWSTVCRWATNSTCWCGMANICMYTPITEERYTCFKRTRTHCGSPHGHLTTLLGKPCLSCGCLSFGRGDWCSKVKGAARNISTLKRTLSTNGWILPTFDDRDIFLKKHLQESKKRDRFALSK